MPTKEEILEFAKRYYYIEHKQGNWDYANESTKTWYLDAAEKAFDSRDVDPETGHHRNLKAVVGMLPTPKGRDWKGQSQRGEHSPGDALPNMLGVTGGQLNPMWVEWLMGFPLGWTDLKDSETQ